MSSRLLADAFGHHGWATGQVLEVCASLTADQLQATVPGTYGSILDTLRHLVGADSWYLFRLTAGRSEVIEEETMTIPELREAMDRQSATWLELANEEIDADAIVVARREDGSETHAATGIRLAQALHHGTDHRSQVCTALTTLGIEPPEIDVWGYGREHGRVTEVASSG